MTTKNDKMTRVPLICLPTLFLRWKGWYWMNCTIIVLICSSVHTCTSYDSTIFFVYMTVIYIFWHTIVYIFNIMTFYIDRLIPWSAWYSICSVMSGTNSLKTLRVCRLTLALRSRSSIGCSQNNRRFHAIICVHSVSYLS